MRARLPGVLFLLVLGCFACTAPETPQKESAGVLSAQALDFGDVTVGKTARLSVTLSSSGKAPLNIVGIERGADLPAAFVAPQPLQNVSASESVALEFSFTPAAIGHLTGKFIIRTDSTTTPTLELAVKGSGVACGGIQITPEVLTFPTLEVGSRTTLPVTIKNDCQLPEVVRITSQPTAVFSVQLPGDEPSLVVSPGATVELPVTFEPAFAEPAGFVSTIEFQPCVTCATMTVTLKGTAVDSFVTVDPKECVEFGLVNPGTSVTKPVTIGNVGSKPITIRDASVAAGNAIFRLEPAALPPIAPNSTQVLSVTYTPTAAVSDTGSLRIVTDNPRSPNFNVCLRGTGGGPDVRITQSTLDFGTVAVGVPRERAIRIENRGLVIPGGNPADTRLQITNAEIIIPTGSTTQVGEFSVNWGTLPLEVNAPSIVTKMVNYMPVDDGSDSAILRLTTNDADTPTIEIALTGVGMTMPPCQLELAPASQLLDFGAVAPDREARLQVAVRNVGSDDCLLDTIQLAVGTHSSFSLDGGPVTQFTLSAGARHYFTIRFAPKNQGGQFTGNLTFGTSNPTAPVRRIDLKATAALGCLMIAPDEVDFGTLSAGCASLTRTVTLFNNCAKAVSIKSLTLAADPTNRFVIAAAPTFPRTSTQASPVKFDLRYVSQKAGDDRGGVFVETDERPEPYLIPLSGRGVNGGAAQEDSWNQEANPNTDVLFVIDDSNSMGPYQQALAANLGTFLNYANQLNSDYRIGVTTTDTTTAGAQGRLVPLDGSRPRIVTRNIPNPTAVFQHNVNVGTSGSPTEQGLEAAKRALEPAMLAGDNAGFIRSDARLSLVFVSDESDSSPESYSYYSAFFMGVKGFRNADKVKVSAIVDVDPNAASYGATYVRLTQDTAGVAVDIKNANWPVDLRRIAEVSFGPLTRFNLTTVPADPSQIDCTINGIAVPRTNGTTTHWVYNASANAIDFMSSAMAQPNATLVCRYPMACIAP